MTIELRDAVNGDGLMDIQGRGFHAINTLNTARLTTVPTEVEDFLEQFANLAIDFDYSEAMKTVPAALASWQGSGSTLAAPIRTACENLLLEFVQNDSDEPVNRLLPSLQYMVDQMEDNDTYVTPSVVASSLATDDDNIGDVAICYTTRRGDGRDQENLLAEAIQIEVVGDTSALTPSIEWAGEAAEANRLSHDWPKGSGAKSRLAAVSAASSLLSNGDFEDTTIANIPDDWIVRVGVIGTTVRVTAAEVQTIAISGSPDGGGYILYWENSDGVLRGTEPLVYNVAGSVVQAALRTIPDLEEITVTTTGTTPNFTHTVTFTGLAGNVAPITSTSHLTGRSGPLITHATTVIGDNGAYKGRALRLHSDGSELTELYHPLTLTREVVYLCHFRIKRMTPDDESSSVSSSSQSSSSSSSSGRSSSSGGSSLSSSSSSSSSSQSSSSSSSSREFSSWSSSSTSSSSQSADEIRFEIVDAIDGGLTRDGEGNDNELRVDAGAISTDAHDSEFFSFRLPRTVTQPVYLRIRIAAPIAAGDSIYIDELAVTKATELYDGGPFVAAFSGVTPAVNEDKWILTLTNDRAGELQEWYHRAFDMAGKGLLLPSSGTTLIPDTLIA